MPKVHIYGLPPENLVHTKVVLFDERTFNSANARRLFEGTPDEHGRVTCEIAEEYIGKKVRLVAMPKMFEYIGEPLEVPPLGVFHTVSLARDMGLYSGTEQLPVEPASWRRDAQEQMRRDFRAAKHKNYLSKSIYWVLTIGSPIAGFFFAGPIGVVIGVAISVVTIFLGKYASGQEYGI